MSWLAEMSILSNIPNLARVKVSGHLPTLSVNFSDVKYRNLMKIVDIAVPRFDDPGTSTAAMPLPSTEGQPIQRRKSTTPFTSAPLYGSAEQDYTVDHEAASQVDESKDKEDEDVFFEAPDLTDGVSSASSCNLCSISLIAKRFIARVSS